MYEAHFGLTERPFSIAPDPRYVYLSQAHEDALAHLLYGVGAGGGFVQLTGEVGTGKTTLVRSLVEQLPEKVSLALIFNPKLSPRELVATLCDELHIDYARDEASLKDLIDRLNARLLASFAEGRRTVLVIDEAQALDSGVLEQVRLLTNLETNREKLLQIVLVGQPELRDSLGRPELRQLAQRITARYHLEPLTLEDTRNYLLHRLSVAGAKRPLFSDAAVQEIHRASGGVPRLINVIADRALLGAYAEGLERVERGLVKKAAGQVRGESPPRRRGTLAWGLGGGLAVAALGVALGWWLAGSEVSQVSPATATPVRVQPAVPPELAGTPGHPDAPVAPPVQSAPRAPAAPAVVAPPVQAAPRPAPSFADWLSANPSVGDSDAALKALFAAWGKGFEPRGRPACLVAREQGLRCLLDRGNWTSLSRLDRPAVIELRDRTGHKRQMALVGLDSRLARFRVGDQTLSFPRTEVEPLWQGDFLVLWEPPPEVPTGMIRPGDRGASVRWLRDRLAEATGQRVAPKAAPQVYDQTLVQALRRFQEERGLTQDGIVGERTLIQLNGVAASVQGPRLSGGGA
jgi:general secretion pathway protein A